MEFPHTPTSPNSTAEVRRMWVVWGMLVGLCIGHLQTNNLGGWEVELVGYPGEFLSYPPAERDAAIASYLPWAVRARSLRLEYDRYCRWIGLVVGPSIGGLIARRLALWLERAWFRASFVVCSLTALVVASTLASLNLFYPADVLALHGKFSGGTSVGHRFGEAFGSVLLVALCLLLFVGLNRLVNGGGEKVSRMPGVTETRPGNETAPGERPGAEGVNS